MAQILIVDDEPAIMMAVRDELLFQGYEVEMALDGPSALEKADTFEPDVMLLDVMLPGMNGFEVCRQLRQKRPDLWIIMLTVREHEVDRIRGLEQGADDYVTKPFSLMELLARVTAVLRRSHKEQSVPEMMRFGDVEIRFRSQTATKAGVAIELPTRGYAILRVLASRPGEVVSREELMNEAWGYDKYPNTRTVDNHFVKLRKALEDEPDSPVYLRTVHGAGYRFVPESPAK